MFVGAGRVGLVRELTEAWEAAVRRKRVSMVVIEGPTGSGKTAVIQALYGQLAMLQSRPAYWPPTLAAAPRPGAERLSPAGAVADGGPGGGRWAQAQRIYPVEMAPEAGSRPGFFWWGLTARPRQFALLDGDPQIRQHVQGIAEAVARADRLTRHRLSLALKTSSLLASLGLLGPVLGALMAATGSAQDAVELLRELPAAAQSRASLLESALHRHGGTVFSVDLLSQALAAGRG